MNLQEIIAHRQQVYQARLADKRARQLELARIRKIREAVRWQEYLKRLGVWREQMAKQQLIFEAKLDQLFRDGKILAIRTVCMRLSGIGYDCNGGSRCGHAAGFSRRDASSVAGPRHCGDGSPEWDNVLRAIEEDR